MPEQQKLWEKLSVEPLWNGRRKVENWKYRLPNGMTADYEIKKEPACVCILALTANKDVVVAKQFRPGPAKVLLELPGGGVEAGEDPMIAAQRELKEETGYTGTFQFVGTSLSDAYSTRIRYNFVATDCTQAFEPENDVEEPIEVELMPLNTFRDHLRSGNLTDVTTGYLGLDFLNLL